VFNAESSFMQRAAQRVEAAASRSARWWPPH